MWAYKYLHKETKLQVPKFKTFFYQNQDLLKLWYEDMEQPLEDRVNFYMRSLKYIAHLSILFIILIALNDSQDEEFRGVCDRRLTCYNSCNKAFFPSLLCKQERDTVIELYGNRFTSFYKYLDPSFVK